jgi:CRISPR-associated protein Cst1
MSSAKLHFTGHALVDVGIAGLCAFASKKRPEDLSLEDLDGAADFMERHYYEGKMNPYLTCVFMNSSFVQPKESPEKRSLFIQSYLRAHRALPSRKVAGKRCAFSGEPAVSPLVRTHFPMFSGEGVLNFRPDGATSVPAAGPYVTALMFLPLASRRSEGRLLAVHADDDAVTLAFARRYLRDNQRLLTLALPSERALVYKDYDREIPGWDATNKKHKFADAKGPRSLVFADLTEAAVEAMPSDTRPRPVALTAYWVSSSGQGPSLDIFSVPSGVVGFILRASQAETQAAWKSIATKFRPVREANDDATEPSKKKSKKTSTPTAGRAGWSKNMAFEDLCAVFEPGFTDRAAAASWLRVHVLGRMDARQAGSGRASTYRETNARNWRLAELFLEEVLGMERSRIETVKRFSDKVADFIAKKNDRKLWQSLAFDRLSEFQGRLRRAQQHSAAGADGLLFGLDEYATVWLHDDRDAYLIRDLICIRVVEKLHEHGWFKQHPEDALDKDTDSENDTEASA